MDEAKYCTVIQEFCIESSVTPAPLLFDLPDKILYLLVCGNLYLRMYLLVNSCWSLCRYFPNYCSPICSYF